MHSTQLCVASLLCYSLTPTQRVGKRSKSLTLQVGLSLENLYSDVLRVEGKIMMPEVNYIWQPQIQKFHILLSQFSLPIIPVFYVC